MHSASMSTWTTQLNTLEQRAAEHDKFSAQLVANLAEPLKQLANRYEELRKLHTDYAIKLEKERDNSYGDLRKMKGKYDSVCQEVENRRKKIDGVFDSGKGKAQVAYSQQQSEMHNVKVGLMVGL
jgi:formin-binding protein 1